jgi:hypothetical protein
MIADAQLAQAEARFPEACAAYGRLVARDSTDVIGWYGVGECQSRDSTVLPDIRSASRFRFRSSRESAIRAYLHILEDRGPPQPAFVYKRLRDLVFIQGNYTRQGTEIGTSQQFAAYPSLQRDTLAFVPYPAIRVFAGDPTVVPRMKAEALDHNRALLRRLLSSWVNNSPSNVDARIALAEILETTEELKSESPDGLSALAQNERALRMASDSAQRLTLAQTQLRLLVKTGDWRNAKAFADSLFTAMPRPVSDTTMSLVGAAALTGRIRLAAEILRAHPTASISQFTSADGTPIERKPAVQQDILTMYAYASLGACTDSLRDLPRRLDVALQSRVAESQRRATRDALVGNTVAFAVPCLGPGFVAGIADSTDYVLGMEQALARGDAADIRRRLARMEAARSADRPGGIAIEYTYIESWLLAQIGDTAAAASRLDRSLNALPTLGKSLLKRPSQSAGLVRAMGLRAELAAAMGDHATIKRWATAVITLWANADPELQPYVARMQALSAGTN